MKKPVKMLLCTDDILAAQFIMQWLAFYNTQIVKFDFVSLYLLKCSVLCMF